MQTDSLKESVEILGEEVSRELQIGLMKLLSLTKGMKNPLHRIAMTVAFMADFCERHDVNKEDFFLVSCQFEKELKVLDWDLKIDKRGKRYFSVPKVHKLEEGEPTA